MADTTNQKGEIGSWAVFNYLKLSHNQHTIIMVPGNPETNFSDKGMSDVKRLYPSVDLSTKRKQLDFGKDIQAKGCDIIEAWNDGDKEHIVWHEVKTDTDVLKYDQEMKNFKPLFNMIGKLYSKHDATDDDLSGTGNAYIEKYQHDEKAKKYYEGWYPKYKRFRADTANPLRPDEHYMWQVMLAYNQHTNGDKTDYELYRGYSAIKIPMDEFLSLPGNPTPQFSAFLVAMTAYWSIDDVKKLYFDDEKIHFNAAIPSDKGNAVLYHLSGMVPTGCMDEEDMPVKIEQ